MDPDKLLVDLHAGKPPSAEVLAEIGEFLETVAPDSCEGGLLETAYAFLLVLGRAEAVEYRSVIERYLESNDPLTVSLVLDVLCLQWEKAGDYLEYVISCALGAPWDPEGDAQTTALKVLGEYLREPTRYGEFAHDPREKELLRLLVKTFEDQLLDECIRQAAYTALGRVSGRGWEQLPSENCLVKLDEDSPDIDWQILDECRERLRGEAANVSSLPPPS